MMEEICSHILDITANALTAGASHITVSIEEDRKNDMLFLSFKDDGKGMDQETVKKVTDPFYSTKKGKRVGLGIPLLKGTAETCGGTFLLTSRPGEGVDIKASLQLDHPDLPPLGNLKDTILVLMAGNPEVDFSFSYKTDESTFSLYTRDIRAIVGDMPLNHPEIVKFLTEYLDEKLRVV
jgi:hypothetical protein